MKKLSRGTIGKIVSVLCVLVLFINIVPRVNRAHATGSFAASNVTFDPVTGFLNFDYTGTPLTSTSVNIEDTSLSTVYWYASNAICTTSHCAVAVYPGNSDSAVTSVQLHSYTGSGYASQTLNYPLPLPTTFTSQNWSAGIRSYQVNGTDGQKTTSGTYSNMTNGTQSITLNTKSIVYVTAHANAFSSVSGTNSYIRTAYNSGGTDTEIGTQGYTNTTSDGQSITAGGVVTLAAGTYTIEMQDKVTSNPSGPTATFHQPGMSIMIIPSP